MTGDHLRAQGADVNKILLTHLEKSFVLLLVLPRAGEVGAKVPDQLHVGGPAPAGHEEGDDVLRVEERGGHPDTQLDLTVLSGSLDTTPLSLTAM